MGYETSTDENSFWRDLSMDFGMVILIWENKLLVLAQTALQPISFSTSAGSCSHHIETNFAKSIRFPNKLVFFVCVDICLWWKYQGEIIVYMVHY